MGHKVTHEQNLCIGCQACVEICTDWKMEGDLAVLQGGKYEGDNGEKEISELGDHQEAAETCPVNCIHVFDEKGNKLV